MGADARTSAPTTPSRARDAARGTGTNSRRASANATRPDPSVPAIAAISGASSRLPTVIAITSATVVPRLSVRPRE